jgi:ABC-2 type transport system permease protein
VKKYIAFFRMNLQTQMQYRAAAWAGIVTQIFWGFLRLMVYRAFYDSSTAAPAMQWRELTAYVWIQQAFFMLINVWTLQNDIAEKVKDGNIAYELCRPYDLYSCWYVRMTAGRIGAAGMRCIPVLIAGFILAPADYRIHTPPDITALALFAVSLLLGMLLLNSIMIFMYIIGIKTLNLRGPRSLIGTVTEWLMGAVVPIPLYPDAMRRVFDFLPFRYIADLPFRVYSGNIAPRDALFQMLAQALWLILLVWLGKLFMRAQLRLVVIQGG